MRTIAVLSLLLASCSLERDFSETFLWPSSVEVAVPTDLGLDYEDVVLETGSDTTVHGWFIPSDEAEGRTVLFSHGNGINITFCSPYYTFLHEAGFNVFVYDYRGFGSSWGGVSVDALLSDMEYAIGYLRSRPDVDADRIALYGVSIGSLPTLRGPSRFTGIAGIVVEDVISPEEFEVQQQREGGASVARSDLGSYFVGYLAIPWALEPKTSAAGVDVPMLYLTGAMKRDLDLQLRVYDAALGPKEMWIMPDVGNVPTSLLVHDREYQTAVSSFLRRIFAGERPEHVAVDFRARQRGREWLTQVTLSRQGTEDMQPWPVELTFLHQGQITFHRVWLREQQQTFELTLPARPMRATAWRYRWVDDDPGEGAWVPQRTPLASAARVQRGLIRYVESMREKSSIDAALEAVDAIESAERNEAFSPELEAELTELYWFIGRELVGSNEPAQKRQGEIWLERCVASAPDDPKMHYWPDSEELLGFAYADVVARASLMLADLYGKEGRDGDAVRVLEAAARVAPGDRALQQKLAEIR